MAIDFSRGQQCDRCSALGLVGYSSPTLDLGLVLCGHHARLQHDALFKAGFTEVVELAPELARFDSPGEAAPVLA